MSVFIKANGSEEDRFKTISEFKWSLLRGGEIQFLWQGKEYGAVPHGDSFIAYRSYDKATGVFDESAEKWYDTPDEVLEYVIGGVRLREIITQVEVVARTA